MKAIWWIRRDLCLQDNMTLRTTLSASRILPVYILDPQLLAATPTRRQKFLFSGLKVLDDELRTRGSWLYAAVIQVKSCRRS
jgi:deoxyribodipyrimidine photo-lyase